MYLLGVFAHLSISFLVKHVISMQHQQGMQFPNMLSVKCLFLTEKALAPIFVLTLGTKTRLQLDGISCLGCLVGVSSASMCAACLNEST